MLLEYKNELLKDFVLIDTDRGLMFIYKNIQKIFCVRYS